MSNENFEYSDIIGHEHYVSTKRKRMSASSRAAQFSSFAALIGYEDAITESSRLTASKRELDDDSLTELNAMLMILAEREAERPLISVTYFKPDSRKDGGSYVVHVGRLRFLDTAEMLLHFVDLKSIPFGDISEIRLLPDDEL